MKKFLIASLIATSACQAASFSTVVAFTSTGAVATYITYRTIKNYQKLAPLHEKVQSEHALLGDSTIRLYRWKRDFWPTARAMMCDRENVKRAFSAAFVNREIMLCNAHGILIQQPTWLEIKAAIAYEKDELHRDLLFLEGHFLTVKPVLPFMNARGFVYDYKAACKKADVDPYAPMSWSEGQEQRVEASVKELYNQKMPITFGLPNIIALPGFNYSMAASIYWRLFKFLKRLEVLEGIVGELAVGYDAVYVRPMENTLNVVVK